MCARMSKGCGVHRRALLIYALQAPSGPVRIMFSEALSTHFHATPRLPSTQPTVLPGNVSCPTCRKWEERAGRCMQRKLAITWNELNAFFMPARHNFHTGTSP